MNNIIQTLQSFIEDMLALRSKKYITSIKEARQDYENDQYFTHKEIFE